MTGLSPRHLSPVWLGSVSCPRSSVGSRAGARTVGAGGNSITFVVDRSPDNHGHVSSSRHVKRSVRFSRTALSCLLHATGYGTYHANLYDVTGLAHFELYRGLGLAGNPGGTGLETNQTALLADLQKQLNKALTQSAADPFGFGFPWNTYDTTSHGGGLAVMGAEYNYLHGPALSGGISPATYAGRQLANVLGANAWGTSLIVNDGSTFPLCMQHQVANLVPMPPNGPPFLSGAAVEGPNSIAAKGTLSGMIACPPNGVDTFAQFNSNAVYKDFVQSYSTVEPAIDLTASSFLAFSWQVAGAPSGTP